MKSDQKMVAVLITVGIIAVIIYTIGQTGDILGDWDYITQHYIGIFPLLFGLALGIWYLFHRR